MIPETDLASRWLGGSVIAASDESFGETENLLTPAPAAFEPGHYGPRGEIVDGWETRRRRSPGHDWVIVRLGAPGIITSVDVDTSFFTGNFPPSVSLDACGCEGYPAPGELAGWEPIVPRSPLTGDGHNQFPVTDGRRFAHVLLAAYPDGGIAWPPGVRPGRPRSAWPGSADHRPGQPAIRRRRRGRQRRLLHLGGPPHPARPGSHHGRRLGNSPPPRRRPRPRDHPARFPGLIHGSCSPLRSSAADPSIMIGRTIRASRPPITRRLPTCSTASLADPARRTIRQPGVTGRRPKLATTIDPAHFRPVIMRDRGPRQAQPHSRRAAPMFYRSSPVSQPAVMASCGTAAG